jgi:hypothetical protein
MHEKAVPGTPPIRLTRAGSARIGQPPEPAGWGQFSPGGIERSTGHRRAHRSPEASKLSEIGRLGSGVGEGDRTPDLQNHNLAL